MTQPAHIVDALRGEVLSVALDLQRGIAAATCPAANMVSFWDLKSHDYVRHVELEYPTGIALSADGRSFLVNHEPKASLSAIDADTLALIVGSTLSTAGLRGSHLTMHEIPKR